ncbi:hypothetical protein BgiBS90_000755, partial [Biomphalaria glabrata]
ALLHFAYSKSEDFGVKHMKRHKRGEGAAASGTRAQGRHNGYQNTYITFTSCICKSYVAHLQLFLCKYELRRLWETGVATLDAQCT